MIKKIILTTFLFLSAFSLYSQSPLLVSTEDILKDYEYLNLEYPRLEGSEAEEKVRDYITNRLDLLNIKYSYFNLSERGQVHSFSRFIEVTIPGQISDTLIIPVPLNHPSQTARDEDGSVNLAIALALLKQFSYYKPKLTVKVLFLGAEYGSDNQYPIGSKLFLKSFYPDYNASILYLNLKKIPSRLIIKCGARGVISPYWLIDHCSESLRKTDIFFLIKGTQNQAFRIGLNAETTIIEPYLQAGYPALSLEGEYGKVSNSYVENWFFSFIRFILNFIDKNKEGFPETWDHHYLFFQLLDFYIIIGEELYVISFISLICSILIYFIFNVKRTKKYINTILRNIWNLPLFLAIAFLVLFISTWIIEIIPFIRNMPDLWRTAPFLFFLFKVGLCFLILVFFIPLLKKIPFSKNGSYYSASAIFYLLINLIFLAIINISFTYYFIWALFFIFFFSVSTNRILKTIFLVISPYWLLKFVYDIFTFSELKICRVMLLSEIWGNLLLAIIILPFLLLLIRFGFYFRLPFSKKKGKRLRINILFILRIVLPVLILALGIYLFIYQPYGKGNLQQIAAVRYIDMEEFQDRLELASNAPLGKIIIYDEKEYFVDNINSREYILNVNRFPNLLEYDIQGFGFLNRKNVTIKLESHNKPFKISFSIQAEKDFVLLDSNFPRLGSAEGNAYEILIGKNPPPTLAVDITLPADMVFQVQIQLEYHNTLLEYSVTANNAEVNKVLRFIKSFEIKT